MELLLMQRNASLQLEVHAITPELRQWLGHSSRQSLYISNRASGMSTPNLSTSVDIYNESIPG